MEILNYFLENIDIKTQKIFHNDRMEWLGKVSAGELQQDYCIHLSSIPIDIVLFTGVAGAIDKKLKQWDIILQIL